MLFEDINYEEPDCLMCDDTGVIEDPESGTIMPCQYCEVFNNMYHKTPTKEKL